MNTPQRFAHAIEDDACPPAGESDWPADMVCRMSMAVSLKRIADTLDAINRTLYLLAPEQ